MNFLFKPFQNKLLRKLILTFLLAACFSSAAWGAWLGNYAYRIQLTLLHTQVTADQTDFPVLISEANLPAGFFTHVAKSTVANIDIAFTDSSGTELSREVVVFTKSPQALEAWVKVPALSSSVDTTIYMYYGDATASHSNDTDTWSNGFAGVWHMQEATGNLNDSTVNGNDGTTNGNLPNPVNAKIKKGQSMDGTTGYADCGASGTLNIKGNNSITIETWVNFSNINAGNYVDFFCKGDRQWSLQKDGPSDYVKFFIYDTTWQVAQSATKPSTSTWYHYVGRYDFSSKEVALFINGVKTATGSATTINDDGYNVCIGQNAQSTNRYIHGTMDEARIQNVARSDSWIATNYNNESAPASFYSAGTEALQPTSTPTNTPTATPTATNNNTSTDTPTLTPSPTITPTLTGTPTVTVSPTFTGTPTPSPTITMTGTHTCTLTPSATVTMTASHSATATQSATATASGTRTPTYTPSATVTPTLTRTPTSTPSATITPTSTKTPVFSPTSTQTKTSTLTPSCTITCTRTQTALRPAAGNLENVVVYPNPYHADRAAEKRIVFAGLTPAATIRIYTLTGQLVRTLEKNDAFASCVWDLANTDGTSVASGIYLYIIKSNSAEFRGKLAILR